MVETILTGIIKSSPIAAALLIVVIVYVRAQNKGLTTFLQAMSERDQKLTQISDRCHKVQVETSKVTADAINHNSKVLGKVERALDRVNGYGTKLS